MPMASEAQRRAMHAAAGGKSTIGIPKKVGKEFAAADQGGKLPKKAGQYSLPPKQVNKVLDVQSDAAVGMPKKSGGYALPKSSKMKGC